MGIGDAPGPSTGNFSERFSGPAEGFGARQNRSWGSHNVNDSDIEALFQEKAEHSTGGINFDKYDDIPVEVSGNNPIKCIESYDELSGIHDKLMLNIRRARYTRPTPVQKYAIPIVLGRRDLMACAQTGSGKTAAFLFPVINSILIEGTAMPPNQNSFNRRKAFPTCLILAPTRELATQIYDESRKFCYQTGILSVVVYGGAEVRSQLQQLDRGCDILGTAQSEGKKREGEREKERERERERERASKRERER
eukprot:TRINITY_DN12836_c0_g1_i3.p1 TRINITY_DN12836_c0_g1~~TRINITY_DN12836_c0_g1_i3.p1  ORF type:complete len:252 (+),score=32.29 TRINITY_DN12836_c0_g1_i3:292-1047(+)